MLEHPIVLWLLLFAPAAAIPGLMAARAGRPLSGYAVAALRVGIFAALVMVLAGLRIPVRTPARKLTLVVALDASRSIAPDQFEWMRRRVAALGRSMSPRDRLAVLEFGRESRVVAPPADPRLARVPADRAAADLGGTDIAAALTTALSLFPADAERRILLLSDGNETRGRAAAQISAMTDNGVRIFALPPPPSSSGRVAMVDLEAPNPVRAHSSFALRLDIQSENPSPIAARVGLLADSGSIGHRDVILQPGLNRFVMPFQFDAYGAHLMRAEVGVNPPVAVVNPAVETGISVISPPRILVVSESAPQSLLSALKLRRYDVDLAAPHSLPRAAEAFLDYQAVILADVSADSLPDPVQQALRDYVGQYGGGLIVTGDALRDSKFHSGALEKALPITFVDQPPPPSREPVAIYLCIDRSNSMSYNSRYPAVRDGERIRYAKEAAIELLRQLDDTDYAGVIAFDSEPYVLSHLRPLGEDRDELIRRISRLEPGGGTDFKEALEIAEREILTSGIAAHQVILLTDGDTNRQYHDHDQLMADYANEHIPVSTIRIGPDLENLVLLQDFAKETGGVFYRVDDIRKLPMLLVNLTQQAMDDKGRRATHLEYAGQSSILSGISSTEIPPIGLFAATVPKDGAEVPLRIRQNDKTSPLLAAWQYGLGRSAIFAADTDSSASLGWVRWNRYAEFWSQLASWVMREGDSGPFSLRVVTRDDGALELRAEKADAKPVNGLVCRIAGDGPAMDVAMTQTGRALYAGESAPLPKGRYNVTLMLKEGDTEQVLVRREVAVAGARAEGHDELRLRPPNIDLLNELARGTGGAVGASDRTIVRRTGAAITLYRNSASFLLPLTIAMILGEVFIRRRYLGD